MDETRMTGAEWCERYGVDFEWTADGTQTDESGWEHHAYTLTLRRDDKTVTSPYKTGMGVKDDPTPGALHVVAMDAQYGALDFDDYVREFGDPGILGSGVQYRVWQVTRKLHADVYAFCTSQQMFEDFCNIRESED